MKFRIVSSRKDYLKIGELTFWDPFFFFLFPLENYIINISYILKLAKFTELWDRKKKKMTDKTRHEGLWNLKFSENDFKMRNNS